MVPLDHTHKAVNAKTYCVQSKKKWKDLHTKAQVLDKEYEKKIEELGSICSTMFKQIKSNSSGGAKSSSTQAEQELEQ